MHSYAGWYYLFAQIIGSFIEIIQSYDQSMGNEEMGSSLNSWMTLLSRFTDKPLSKALVNSIDQHYTYFWANDRLNSMKKDDEFLNQCPRVVKRHVLLNYLYDDVIFKHRLFFLTTQNKDSKFLYDVCFGFKPAKFENLDHEQLILDEENEVTDLYFIQEGKVGIGYYMMT